MTARTQSIPDSQYQHLLDCYRSGQIEESAWQEHLQDKGFREWVEGQGKPQKKRKLFRNSKFNPMKTREGEEIGGGWWVFRRGDSTGRVRVPVWPYEHSSRDDAAAQATRLAMKNPGETFVVVGEVGSVSISDGDATFCTRTADSDTALIGELVEALAKVERSLSRYKAPKPDYYALIGPIRSALTRARKRTGGK